MGTTNTAGQSVGRRHRRWLARLTLTLLLWLLPACGAAGPVAPTAQRTETDGAAPAARPTAETKAAAKPADSGPVAVPANVGGGIVFTDGQHLWVADPEARPRTSGAQRELLDTRGKGTITDPAWSPDRTQIAYSYTPVPTRDGEFGSDIYVIGLNGGAPQALFSRDVDGGLARAPVWAPDGGAIYFSYSFTQTKPGQTIGDLVQRIERLDLKTRARTVIANDADLPALSPDGSQLAFIRFSNESVETPALWIARADGSEARQLVEAAAFQALWAPRFAPDGKQLLFTAAGGDRSKPRLTIQTPRAVGLRWPLVEPPSVRAHGFPMDFWLVDTVSGQRQLLAALGADDLFAAWAPDGKRLAYITVEGLFLLDLTSGSLTMLNQTPAFGSVDWSR